MSLDLLVSGLRHSDPASQAQKIVQPMFTHLQLPPLQCDTSHPQQSTSKISSGASFMLGATVIGLRMFPSLSLPWSIASRGGILPDSDSFHALGSLIMGMLDILSASIWCWWKGTRLDCSTTAGFLLPHFDSALGHTLAGEVKLFTIAGAEEPCSYCNYIIFVEELPITERRSAAIVSRASKACFFPIPNVPGTV